MISIAREQKGEISPVSDFVRLLLVIQSLANRLFMYDKVAIVPSDCHRIILEHTQLESPRQ